MGELSALAGSFGLVGGLVGAWACVYCCALAHAGEQRRRGPVRVAVAPV